MIIASLSKLKKPNDSLGATWRPPEMEQGKKKRTSYDLRALKTQCLRIAQDAPQRKVQEELQAMAVRIEALRHIWHTWEGGAEESDTPSFSY